MTLRTVSPQRYLQHAIWILVIVSCDSFTPEPEEQLTFSESKYYILPESSIVIDLKSVIKRSFTSISLAAAQSATRGAVTQLDPFLLKYTPHADFNQGEDKIVVSVRLSDGSMRKATVRIIMKDNISEFSCGAYAVEDRINMNPNSTIVIHPLKNDRNCGVKGFVNVFIHHKPQFGDAVVAGDSIIYIPGPSFAFRDELVYRLSTDGVDDVAYGLISIR